MKSNSKFEVHLLRPRLTKLKREAAILRCRSGRAIQIHLIIKPATLSSNKTVHLSDTLRVAELKVDWVLPAPLTPKPSGLGVRKAKLDIATIKPKPLGL